MVNNDIEQFKKAYSRLSGLSGCDLGEYSISKDGNTVGFGCITNKNIQTFLVLPGTTLIGAGAFRFCTKLTSISLPESLTRICNDAFFTCTSLTEIHLPSNLLTIGDYAFSECVNLTSITLPSSVTSIGYHTFYKCTNLKDIYIQKPRNSIPGADWGAPGKIKIHWAET